MVYNVRTGFQGKMANTHVSLMCNNQRDKKKWRPVCNLCMCFSPSSHYSNLFERMYPIHVLPCLWFVLHICPGHSALVETWHVQLDLSARAWFSFLWSPVFPPPPSLPSKLWNKSWEMRGPPTPSLLLISRCANRRSTQDQTVTLPKC